jgi:hypothetical protein
VYGFSSAVGGNGVIGEANNGTGAYGVWGKSTSGYAGYFSGRVNALGAVTATNAGDAFTGTSTLGTSNAGVHGISTVAGGNGVIGEANNGANAYGVWGKSTNGFAGFFDGKVQVNGQMTARIVQITGADFSEKFEVGHKGSELRPGTVLSIDPDRPGKLVVSGKAYDRRVAGVLSGAGGVSTALLLGQPGTLADGDQPVALSGRVYVWADASTGAINPGDLLTTSAVRGHAMKVTDHSRATGAVLGKAMTGLAKGRGLVLVLVTLQ